MIIRGTNSLINKISELEKIFKALEEAESQKKRTSKNKLKDE